jgi:hypothetical protein
MFKIRPRLPGLSVDELPGLLGETPNVIENDYQPLPVNWDNVSTSPTGITHCNFFPAKSNGDVKEFSCLPFLDNSSPEAERLNSYPA